MKKHARRRNPAMPHNIEKHPVHRGMYIGYADGPWRIMGTSGSWHAHRRMDPPATLAASSLEDMSRKLTAYEFTHTSPRRSNPRDLATEAKFRDEAEKIRGMREHLYSSGGTEFRRLHQSQLKYHTSVRSGTERLIKTAQARRGAVKAGRDLDTEAQFKREAGRIALLRARLFDGGNYTMDRAGDLEISRVRRGQTSYARSVRASTEGLIRKGASKKRPGAKSRPAAKVRARALSQIDWSKAEHHRAPDNWHEEYTWDDNTMRVTGRRMNPRAGRPKPLNGRASQTDLDAMRFGYRLRRLEKMGFVFKLKPVTGIPTTGHRGIPGQEFIWPLVITHPRYGTVTVFSKRSEGIPGLVRLAAKAVASLRGSRETRGKGYR
jgi:hypothetical protein